MSKRPETLTREAIVAEAFTWLRTPYRHLADIKGVGVDCAMILVRVYQFVGLVPPDYDPRPYDPEWFLHRDEERYMAGMEQFSKRIEPSAAKIGDLELYRFGRTASHGAIIVSDEHMIHAYRQTRQVELCERRTFASRLDSCWSVLA